MEKLPVAIDCKHYAPAVLLLRAADTKWFLFQMKETVTGKIVNKALAIGVDLKPIEWEWRLKTSDENKIHTDFSTLAETVRNTPGLREVSVWGYAKVKGLISKDHGYGKP